MTVCHRVAADGGVFVDSALLTMASATPGAAIHYTLDGSDPTEQSALYTGAFTLEQTDIEVRAIAIHFWPPELKESNVSVSNVFTIKASTPKIDPSEGAFTAKVLVKLTSATSGAQIRCTLDGSEPTAESAVCVSPVLITETGTLLKAVATKEGLAVSDVASMGSPVVIKATPPKLTPDGGTFTDQVVVVLSCVTEGCTMHYTTDGGVPSQASTLYTQPILVETTGTVIRAIAVAAGKAVSDASVSAEYSIETAAPVFSANGTEWGEADNLLEYYVENAIITMESSSAGADIYFTTDGRVPSEDAGATLYTEAYHDTKLGRETLKAMAYAPGKLPSPVSTSVIYDIVRRTTPPRILPAASGPYTAKVLVTIQDPDQGQVFLTMDGSEPSHASIPYHGPFTITDIGTTVVKAIATKDHQADSHIITSSFLVLEQVKTPLISPSAGTYTDNVTVFLECATEGAVIRYTTDSTEPNAASAQYNPELGVVLTVGADGEEKGYFVKAMGMKAPEMGDSRVATSGLILVQPQVEAPTLTPDMEGPYKDSVDVYIACETAGATIYYTTDGSEPSEGSRVYDPTKPVTLYQTDKVVKAIAFAPHMAASEVADSVPYVIEVSDPVFEPGLF